MAAQLSALRQERPLAGRRQPAWPGEIDAAEPGRRHDSDERHPALERTVFCEQHAAGNHLANFLLRNGPLALVLWARKTINIWPKAFDPDLDVVVVRFANEDYATKFRLMNREATSLRNTEQAPWLARASTRKMIIVVLALVLLGWRVLGSN
ncbi:hypothetical protein GM658_12925 [Pseudoduganella eburnea]|uniref:Uncharacterized protein n=1 Tax=Massilia eburnea TaxID=1776165 RepID=A0A6L6QGL2_9BURK|nr:hypothetical protein [Massilia eburnea]MTW11502.1 hypothetical protein [Massilia eburnea]